ncbi:MAG TPA: DinB family protein [Candidatus Sulfotelmatobacter sp.]|nr:DinB family protein [Candidatus Sulfotelmatobacter sp.]
MSQALTELLRGKGAHVDPIACMEDVNAELANRRIDDFPHSIADLVFHMNYWMNYELKRIRGQNAEFPQHNSESFPSMPQNWDQLRRDFSWFLSQFAELAASSREEMNREIGSIHQAGEKVAGTMEALLWQMVAHNSYHTGQIATIRRTLNAWPPKSGGDSW